MEEIRAVIDMDPNWSYGYVYLAANLSDSSEAIGLIKKAFKLNPLPPPWYFTYLGLSYARIRMYEEAITTYKKGLQKWPDYFWNHVGLASVYSILGREEDARFEVSEVLEINSHYSLACMKPIIESYKDEAIRKRLTEGLEKAGLK